MNEEWHDQGVDDPGGEIRREERRRVARDLNDRTSRAIAALQLQLGVLKRDGQIDYASIVDECEELVEEIRRQIGSIGGPQD